MSTDQTAWSEAVRQAADQLTALCEDLKNAPVEERLNALAALKHAFHDLHHCAQREAVSAARDQGWPLRRIATALRCSHEQVRLLSA
ncbi:hypothetical protein [Streptomyces sp. 1222.5]|uniref:hypothetical protein n=1 Tax=Streptomyces sp. 1222.5 TaxID=1881026 RepID=UPI003D70DC5D